MLIIEQMSTQKSKIDDTYLKNNINESNENYNNQDCISSALDKTVTSHISDCDNTLVSQKESKISHMQVSSKIRNLINANSNTNDIINNDAIKKDKALNQNFDSTLNYETCSDEIMDKKKSSHENDYSNKINSEIQELKFLNLNTQNIFSEISSKIYIDSNDQLKKYVYDNNMNCRSNNNRAVYSSFNNHYHEKTINTATKSLKEEIADTVKNLTNKLDEFKYDNKYIEHRHKQDILKEKEFELAITNKNCNRNDNPNSDKDILYPKSEVELNNYDTNDIQSIQERSDNQIEENIKEEPEGDNIVAENGKKDNHHYDVNNSNSEMQQNNFMHYKKSGQTKEKNLISNPYDKFLEDTLEQSLNFNAFNSNKNISNPGDGNNSKKPSKLNKRDETQNMLLNHMKNLIHNIKDEMAELKDIKIEKKKMVLNKLEDNKATILSNNSSNKDNFSKKNLIFLSEKMDPKEVSNREINNKLATESNSENSAIANPNDSASEANQGKYVLNNTKENFMKNNMLNNNHHQIIDKSLCDKNEICKFFETKRSWKQNKNESILHSLKKERDKENSIYDNLINIDTNKGTKSTFSNHNFPSLNIRSPDKNNAEHADNMSSLDNPYQNRISYKDFGYKNEPNLIAKHESKNNKNDNSQYGQKKQMEYSNNEEDFNHENIEELENNQNDSDNLSENELSSIHQSIKAEINSQNILNNFKDYYADNQIKDDYHSKNFIKNSADDFNKNNKTQEKKLKNISDNDLLNGQKDNQNFNSDKQHLILDNLNKARNNNSNKNINYISDAVRNENPTFEIEIKKPLVTNRLHFSDEEFENLNPNKATVDENEFEEINIGNNKKDMLLNLDYKEFYSNENNNSNNNCKNYKSESSNREPKNEITNGYRKKNSIANSEYNKMPEADLYRNNIVEENFQDIFPEKNLSIKENQNHYQTGLAIKNNFIQKAEPNGSKHQKEKSSKNNILFENAEDIILGNLESPNNFNNIFNKDKNNSPTSGSSENNISNFKNKNDIQDAYENKINRFNLDYNIIGTNLGNDNLKIIEYENLHLDNKVLKYQQGEDSNDLIKYKNKILEFGNYENEEQKYLILIFYYYLSFYLLAKNNICRKDKLKILELRRQKKLREINERRKSQSKSNPKYNKAKYKPNYEEDNDQAKDISQQEELIYQDLYVNEGGNKLEECTNNSNIDNKAVSINKKVTENNKNINNKPSKNSLKNYLSEKNLKAQKNKINDDLSFKQNLKEDLKNINKNINYVSTLFITSCLF